MSGNSSGGESSALRYPLGAVELIGGAVASYFGAPEAGVPLMTSGVGQLSGMSNNPTSGLSSAMGGGMGMMGGGMGNMGGMGSSSGSSSGGSSAGGGSSGGMGSIPGLSSMGGGGSSDQSSVDSMAQSTGYASSAAAAEAAKPNTPTAVGRNQQLAKAIAQAMQQQSQQQGQQQSQGQPVQPQPPVNARMQRNGQVQVQPTTPPVAPQATASGDPSPMQAYLEYRQGTGVA